MCYRNIMMLDLDYKDGIFERPKQIADHLTNICKQHNLAMMLY